MIEHIDITGVNSYSPDDKVKKYVHKKIGGLSRLTPRHARKSLRAEVKISEINKSRDNKYEVEAILYLPEKTLTAKDSTMNVMAATDIVEAKLAAQLRKYKTQRAPHVSKRGVLDRFKRSFAREQQS